MDTHHKILLAVDGSEQSMNAVKYISKILSPAHSELVLFHVYSEAPDPVLDFRPRQESEGGVSPFNEWYRRQQKLINDFILQATGVILENGFDRARLRVKTQPKKVGIARDILEESKGGYRAVVMGRTGKSNVAGISIGSVANKLIEKCGHAALILVGSSPETDHVVMANDGSKDAIGAALCFGSLVKASDIRVVICHVIRSLPVEDQQISSAYGAEWIESIKQENKPLMDEIKYKLVNMGFQWSRIESEFVSYASRAAGIVEHSRKGGFGTVVMGRRGVTVVKEFFMGRVANKVIQLGDKLAVWIV